eukprot:TRINITY_DN6663_c0_g1_i7.p1 TRINITY_DN6663_c0_g1~~TRINITY_DN6663_c0_g1_i7.p1  ORF type:complete len:870 (+),score=223.42 TRINITY_DN6663_c0_g1_i7:1043-3652(+)
MGLNAPGLIDLSVFENTAYILHGIDDMKISSIEFNSIEYIKRWCSRDSFARAIYLIEKYDVRDLVFLRDFYGQLKSNNIDELLPIIESIRKRIEDCEGKEEEERRQQEILAEKLKLKEEENQRKADTLDRIIEIGRNGEDGTEHMDSLVKKNLVSVIEVGESSMESEDSESLYISGEFEAADIAIDENMISKPRKKRRRRRKRHAKIEAPVKEIRVPRTSDEIEVPISSGKESVPSDSGGSSPSDILDGIKKFTDRLRITGEHPITSYSGSDSGEEDSSWSYEYVSDSEQSSESSAYSSKNKSRIDEHSRSTCENLMTIKKYDYNYFNTNISDGPNNILKKKITPLLVEWMEAHNHESDSPSYWIIELITSCFEFQVMRYEKYQENENEEDYEILAYQDWEESTALDFLKKYFHLLDLDQAVTICNIRDWNNCLKYIHTREDELYLNSKKKTSQFLIRKEIEDYLHSGEHESALSKLISANSMNLNLRFFHELFYNCPEDTIQFCVSAYPTILPKNVRNATENQPRNYLMYLEYMMNNQIECREDKELVHSWFKGYLEDENVYRDVLFDGDKPKIGAHHYHWKWKDILLKILNESNEYSFDYKFIQDLCESYGFFPGLFVIYTKHYQLEKAIDLVLNMDDPESFKELMNNPLTSDMYFWNYFKEQYNILYTDNRNIENVSINLEIIVEVLADSMGPRRTVDVLLEWKENSGYISDALNLLPPTIFCSLIRKGRNILKNRGLIRETLSTIDRHLWGQKDTIIAPQFRVTEKYELNGDQNIESLPFLREDKKQGMKMDFRYNSPIPSHYEEMNSHWGIYTNLSGKCGVCTLPLDAAEADVVVFRCGHSFHDCCVPEEACPTCFSKNFTTLL